MAETDPKSVQDLTAVVNWKETIAVTRIDDLEKNIADLMTQAGVEEIEGGENKVKEGGEAS
ncbi:heat shock factor-binding protein 1 [Triplophysa rosa]|uniref:Heat shock factor-binding protein 1 n=1 Tax=Triplophysa rosa TaxID=992332 RepID=A0A9W7WHQ1_TRIRA|nr:heat shock factor-binding protein 1 [Triplophysa rosa]